MIETKLSKKKMNIQLKNMKKNKNRNINKI